MKKTMAVILVLSVILILGGCIGIDMPFNGLVTFHEIQVTVPEDYIRDSTQSNADLWCFEKGGYDQIIILSRKDVGEDASTAIDNYVEYMIEQGCDSERTSFQACDAVHTTYTQNGVYCQEMLFVLNNSFYAVALRGGTEEEFNGLLASVTVSFA